MTQTRANGDCAVVFSEKLMLRWSTIYLTFNTESCKLQKTLSLKAATSINYQYTKLDTGVRNPLSG